MALLTRRPPERRQSFYAGLLHDHVQRLGMVRRFYPSELCSLVDYLFQIYIPVSLLPHAVCVAVIFSASDQILD